MFLIVMLPTFAASIFLLNGMRNITRDKTIESALAKADSLSYWVSEIVSNGEQAVSSAMTDPTITGFLTEEHEDQSSYYKFYSEHRLDKLISLPASAENMFIYVSRPDFVYSSSFLKTDFQTASSAWYIQATSSSAPVWAVVHDPVADGQRLACIGSIRSNGEILGVAMVTISNDWIENVPLDDAMSYSFMLNGVVYNSDAPNILPGTDLSDKRDYYINDTYKTYDTSLYGVRGYGVVRNIRIGSDVYQIALYLPNQSIAYELDRLSFIYGGYCALMVVLSLLIILLFTSTFSARIKTLSDKMHKVADGDFNVSFNDSGTDEISLLYDDLSLMISNMRRLINDNYEAKLQGEAIKFTQMEAEFKALSSQINPHFLYNTLETIRMKAYVNNDKETADLVKKLGKFMRRCLEFKDTEVTLKSELEFTKAYLELQQARFGDRITYHIYSEVDGEYMILPLLIQPLVENAFVHGVEASKGGGKIDIRVVYHNEYVFVDVSDNGQGMSEERLKELEHKLEVSDTSSGKSIGLTNVHKRIQMYHGNKYGMKVTSTEGQGTTIRLTLPREPEKGLMGGASQEK
ncbi:MAG: sensor histidine kinase [Oscillospiraceae bacterium]|nr:sensor histidine kinase [Oscillospiraceae bacterium]